MNHSDVRPLIPGAVTAALALTLLAGCGGQPAEVPAVATPSVTLSHDRAPAGSPLEITYKFVVANDAPAFTENYRVLAHIMDTDEEMMWTDDHDPPTPTTQWKPGQTIEYTRTIFVPIFPYVGEATIQVGLYSTADQTRLPLGGQDAGQRAYPAAHFQLLPQTENLFTVFKEGWHPAEVATASGVEWQWTKKEAILAFKNPKTDSTLYLDLDSPGDQLHGTQQVQVVLGDAVVDEFAVTPAERLLRKTKLPAANMGAGEMSEVQIRVDQTFVPIKVSGSGSKDNRELGVRVFHAYVDPR